MALTICHCTTIAVRLAALHYTVELANQRWLGTKSRSGILYIGSLSIVRRSTSEAWSKSIIPRCNITISLVLLF